MHHQVTPLDRPLPPGEGRGEGRGEGLPAVPKQVDFFKTSEGELPGSDDGWLPHAGNVKTTRWPTNTEAPAPGTGDRSNELLLIAPVTPRSTIVCARSASAAVVTNWLP